MSEYEDAVYLAVNALAVGFAVAAAETGDERRFETAGRFSDSGEQRCDILAAGCESVPPQHLGIADEE